MSWEAQTAVMKMSIGDATSKLILLGLANHAKSDGTAAWPGTATLGEYAECSPATTKRKISYLLSRGFIREGDQRIVSHVDARYRPIVYDVAMSQAQADEWAAGHDPARGVRAVAAANGSRGAAARIARSQGAQSEPPTPAEDRDPGGSPEGPGGSPGGSNPGTQGAHSCEPLTVREPGTEPKNSTAASGAGAPGDPDDPMVKYRRDASGLVACWVDGWRRAHPGQGDPPGSVIRPVAGQAARYVKGVDPTNDDQWRPSLRAAWMAGEDGERDIARYYGRPESHYRRIQNGHGRRGSNLHVEDRTPEQRRREAALHGAVGDDW